ncbi:hypothetical protein SM124_05780 [Bacillus sp. 31A1R]|uniref:WYL domain-containing protein n=1 Tax=Robertmurraya mangrovi TaxID=3098077 RepID=A0ABU5IVT2_9BACI|nr:hypothetical protein [Bacillus sp. 31A1R]MDZ5471251.1 hypothetical protein [Bacillus sp. 31A1R]
MSNLHRLQWFDQEIRMNRFPNANALANQFEISLRQAQRDVEYLRNSLNAPLAYDAKNRGYGYEDPAFTLPNVYITEEEKRLLKYLAYRYKEFSKTDKMNRLAQLFNRIGSDEIEELEGITVPHFSVDFRSSNLYYELKKSMKMKRKVKITFQQGMFGILASIAHVYYIYRKHEVDYIDVFLEEKDGLDTIRFESVIEYEVLNETFEIQPQLIKQPYEMKIKKQPFLAEVKGNSLFEEELDSFFSFEKNEDHYKIEYNDEEELLQLLMKSMNWEKVLSPNWLKNKLYQRLQNIMEKLNMEK